MTLFVAEVVNKIVQRIMIIYTGSYKARSYTNMEMNYFHSPNIFSHIIAKPNRHFNACDQLEGINFLFVCITVKKYRFTLKTESNESRLGIYRPDAIVVRIQFNLTLTCDPI